MSARALLESAMARPLQISLRLPRDIVEKVKKSSAGGRKLEKKKVAPPLTSQTFEKGPLNPTRQTTLAELVPSAMKVLIRKEMGAGASNPARHTKPQCFDNQ